MKPQVIRTENGEELVVLPRREYEGLLKRRVDEDTGMSHLVARETAAVRAKREVALPAAIAEAIARGGNPIRVVREWRGMTQVQLGAHATNVGQSYLSQIESGKKHGSLDVLRQLAKALKVPLDLLLPD